jgi:hypothetical protein
MQTFDRVTEDVTDVYASNDTMVIMNCKENCPS